MLYIYMLYINYNIFTYKYVNIRVITYILLAYIFTYDNVLIHITDIFITDKMLIIYYKLRISY